MSIATNFPTIKPSLSLDFANTGVLDPRVTFTRASTGTYYDGVTTAKAEENLLLQSQDFTTSWTNVNSTDTANTEVAPDGTTTADTITDNATAGSHSVYQTVSVSANTTYVVSCFLKAGTSNYAILAFTDAGTSQRYFAADFKLDDGTVRTSGAGTNGTLTSATITAAGNGWYRCVIIGQTNAVSANNRIYVGVSDGTSALGSFGIGSYTGTGSTIYAWGAQLEQRSAVSSYTPTTTQAIVNYIPVLQTAASGVARFDHNPTTSEALGLLIEEQRTNVLTYSSDFSNAAWVKQASVSVSANTNVAPDGTLSGDTVQADSGFSIYQGVTISSGQAYTHSCYVKAGTATAVIFRDDTGAGRHIIFNPATGVITTTSGSLLGYGSTSVGNGWWRYWFSFTSDSTTGRCNLRPDSAGNAQTFIVWGAQLEAGAFPTSAIQTTSAQVTRLADAASMTGTNFSSWYNAGEGTIYAEWEVPYATTNIYRRLFSFNQGLQSSNEISIQAEGTNSGKWAFSIGTTAAGNQAFLFSSVKSSNTAIKAAGVYATNNAAVSFDGATAVIDTSVTLPNTATILDIGVGANGANSVVCGHISKLSYYPQALTATNLQALTS